MIMFPLTFEPDDNGTLLVTCPVLPEVTTYGDDKIDALRRGGAAVEEALAARIARWEDIRAPSGKELAQAVRESRATGIPLLAEMKLDLYLACREAGVTRAELSRRLGWHREQVDRLFRFDHASRVEQIEAALRAVGQAIDVRRVEAPEIRALPRKASGRISSRATPKRSRKRA